jgi:chemotaxis protein MotB
MNRRLLLLGLIPAAAQAASRDAELIEQLDREVIAQKQRIKYLQEQLAHCGEMPGIPPIFTELTQILTGSEASLERDGATVRITLPGDFLFVPDSTKVRDETFPTLDLITTAIKLHDVRVSLHLHTSNAPPPAAVRKTYPGNWEWSAALAASLTRVLIDRFFLPVRYFTLAAHGDSKPIVSNEEPNARKLNHRAVIEIVPPPLPPMPSPWGPT